MFQKYRSHSNVIFLLFSTLTIWFGWNIGTSSCPGPGNRTSGFHWPLRPSWPEIFPVNRSASDQGTFRLEPPEVQNVYPRIWPRVLFSYPCPWWEERAVLVYAFLDALILYPLYLSILKACRIIWRYSKNSIIYKRRSNLRCVFRSPKC